MQPLEKPAPSQEPFPELEQYSPDKIWKPLDLPPPRGEPMRISLSNNSSRERLSELIREKYARLAEPLNLYTALAGQRAFHESDAFIRLLIGSNRAGKSLVAAVEFARCVLNRDPFHKYPSQGTVYIVGKSLKHIGDTIYKKIFLKGSLPKIVPIGDGRWEVFKPWIPDHAERKHLVKRSSPLIPERLIVPGSVAFENKREGEISYLKLTTGWDVRFFSARGLLPQGGTADLIWLDEEIVDSQDGPWIPEMIARTIDTGGKIIWSATPQSGFDNLNDLSEKADRQLEMWHADPEKNPKPDIVRFELKVDENQYQSKENVDRAKRTWSAEEAAVRFGGMSILNSSRVYPEYSLRMHGIPLAKVPQHWTRIAVVDPGHSVCAVLFACVPPLEECPHKLETVICYDELYIEQCNAALFGAKMKEKVGGDFFEVFIIDGHGARPTDAGTGLSIEYQYTKAMEANRVKSAVSGYGFVYGRSDREGGVLKVHEFLMERPNARPRLLVATVPGDDSDTKLANLNFEMKRYRKKRVANRTIDTPDDKGPTHLVQCVRYLCGYDPQYVDRPVESAGMRAFRAVRKWGTNINGGGRGDRPYVNLGRG